MHPPPKGPGHSLTFRSPSIGARLLVPVAWDNKDPPTAQPMAASASPVATDPPETSKNGRDTATTTPKTEVPDKEESPAGDENEGDTDGTEGPHGRR